MRVYEAMQALLNNRMRLLKVFVVILHIIVSITGGNCIVYAVKDAYPLLSKPLVL